MSRDMRLKKAYNFFQGIRSAPIAFTVSDIVNATGYTTGTVRTYILKYWNRFLREQGDGTYLLGHFEEYDLDTFLRLSSQKTSINQDPFKPQNISHQAEELLKKARESALLAVQVYNNPLVSFRAPGFIVHMVIALTSLFHAINEQLGEDYWYKDEFGSDIKFRNGRKYWELSHCLSEYWQSETNPVRSNIDYFIDIRNEVEHRFAPSFDNLIAGECQALLFNFETLLLQHFGPYYSIGAQVAVPVQLSRVSHQARLEALKEMQKTDYLILKELTEGYRKRLPDDVIYSQDYAFNVFLVPKVGSKPNSSDASIEFIRAEDLTPEKESELQRCIALIKTRTVPVANPGKLKPKTVVERVVDGGVSGFNIMHHACAWRHYKVRPREKKADGCNELYCHYDEPHNDFIYTEEWVAFLIKKLSDPDEYSRVLTSRA